MTVVQSLAGAFEPWQSAYNNSKTIATSVIFVHLAAMLFGGGIAIAADRLTLKAIRQDADARTRALRDLDLTHAVVIISLVFSFVSGLALAAADIKNFASSPVFWVKMALVASLLVNGAVLRSTERSAMKGSDPAVNGRLWARLKLTSILSIILWTCVLLAGTILVNAT